MSRESKRLDCASSLIASVLLSWATTVGADALGTAPVSEASDCELALYPSLEWAVCEAQNAAVGLQGPVTQAPPADELIGAMGAYHVERLRTIFEDPERMPDPSFATVGGCPPSPSLANWPAADGLVEPVVFTSRSGGTLSGHVWATRAGPPKRPGVVIINGSVLACEQVYWYAAQALAKAGFVVMTFDPQGEGMSDVFGEEPDTFEDAFGGLLFPAGLLAPELDRGPSLGGMGFPYYDGGVDALDFFLSSPTTSYVPRPSRTSGTSHAPKHERRVSEGWNSAYNPLWALLDPSTIGLAGHSYGALAASWLGQADPRVRAVVGWDSLCFPVWPSPGEVEAWSAEPANQVAGVAVPLSYGHAWECIGAPEGPAPPITKPALNLTADYFLATLPYARPPRPDDKSRASLEYSSAGVDTGSIVIRGGTHYEFADDQGQTPKSSRGLDLVTWYTTAWFAKYLQHDPNADRMLLTARWRNDSATGAVDSGGDPNLFSWYYGSRLDVTLASGEPYACENLRNGCAGQFQASEDCGPAEYSFLAIDTSQGAGPPAVCAMQE